MKKLKKKHNDVQKNNGDDKKMEGGPFLSFVLLDKDEADIRKIAADLKEDWGIDIPDEDFSCVHHEKKEEDSIVSSLEGMKIAVSWMHAPIPNNDAIENARANFRWPEAVSVVKRHKAMLMVYVGHNKDSVLEAGKIMAKLCSSCLKQEHATAVNTVGSVFPPEEYISFAEQYIKAGKYPILNLVFFGLYSQDQGKTISGYTFGLQCFCREELEIVNSDMQPNDVTELLMSIAGYELGSDIFLEDKETVGFSDEETYIVKKSNGVAVKGESLKVMRK